MTDSQRDLELLRASERRYRGLVERSPVPMLVLRGGAIILANTAAAELFGAGSAYELLGRDLREHLARDDDSDELVDTRTTEGRLLRLDGRVIHVEVSDTLASLADNEIHTVIRDVHERKEFESRMQMVDRMVSVGTLAAGVAHEVNTPLAYVLSNLDFGLDELKSRTRMSVDELRELRDALLEAYDGATRMRDIVRDLRTFSRSDDGSVGPVDVLRVLESSINMTSQEIRTRARLYKNLERVPTVVSSESRLGQVFLNLLLNAAQAIPSGEPDVHSVTVTSRRSSDNDAIVEISDTGSGISPEVLSRIFDPFFTTKPVGTGTGLGLSICRSIVAGAGGRIDVDTTPGVGTTFRVVLPGVTEKPRPAGRTSYLPPAESARVVAIDDDPLVGRAIARVLRGHDVVAFESAEDALPRLLDPSEAFDLILCDLMMPRMTGRELHEALVEKAPSRLDTLVFMSGGATTPELCEFVERGDVRVIDKPFDAAALRALVQHCLRR